MTIKADLNKFRKCVARNDSYLSVSKDMGVSRQTVTRLIKKHGIDISHFSTARGRFSGKEVLCKDSKSGNSTIRSLIVRNELIKYVCSICGLGPEWNGGKLVLEIDHINGINNDNRIENLRFLCPNCHSQTDTSRGRNTTGKRKPRLDKKDIIRNIVELNKLNIPLNSSYIQAHHYDLYRYACNKFGSWSNAISESGLSYESVRLTQKWSKEDVIKEMSIILNQYPNINCSKLAELNGPLYAAMRRYFGNLTRFCKELEQCLG